MLASMIGSSSASQHLQKTLSSKNANYTTPSLEQRTKSPILGSLKAHQGVAPYAARLVHKQIPEPDIPKNA
jgi:hypothetical protein